MDSLDEMLLQQYLLQRRINGYDIEDQTLTQRIANLKLNVFAMEHELHEMIDETHWKEWATPPLGGVFINYDEARKEAIDALHFLLNIFLHLGMSGIDIREAYMRKSGINFKRQEDGYDGIAKKCPQCRRALDDIEVKEVVVDSGPLPPHVVIHCVCGATLGARPV